jgi:hypothetical protein
VPPRKPSRQLPPRRRLSHLLPPQRRLSRLLSPRRFSRLVSPQRRLSCLRLHLLGLSCLRQLSLSLSCLRLLSRSLSCLQPPPFHLCRLSLWLIAVVITMACRRRLPLLTETVAIVDRRRDSLCYGQSLLSPDTDAEDVLLRFVVV